MYKLFFKRILDLVFALLLLILFSPFLFVITVALFFLNNQEIFFTQLRPGQNEKIFRLYKFKTMRDLYNCDGELLPDYQRITFLGRFLRKTSIDELPQLVNVIKGDISIVGPRPLLIEYLKLYNAVQKRRHLVKPGITGWAQVNGRNAITWSEKFELDVFYVDNISFILDLKIIGLTFFKVLRSEGVNSSENITMEKFNGLN